MRGDRRSLELIRKRICDGLSGAIEGDRVLLCVQDNVVAGCKGRANVRAGVFEHGGGGAGVGHEKAETG